MTVTNMLFLNQLKQNCEIYANKPAIEYILPDRCDTVTYGQLETAVQKTMAYLQSLGVQPGDRVALQLPKGLPFVYLHLAIMRLNAICLPLNPAYPAHELSYFLNDSGAKVFFADANDQEKLALTASELQTTVYLSESGPGSFDALLADIGLRHAILPDLPTDAHASAMMLYTSGTTGHPKGAEITHG